MPSISPGIPHLICAVTQQDASDTISDIVLFLEAIFGEEGSQVERDNLLQGTQKITGQAGQVKHSPEPTLSKTILLVGLEREVYSQHYGNPCKNSNMILGSLSKAMTMTSL